MHTLSICSWSEICYPMLSIIDLLLRQLFVVFISRITLIGIKIAFDHFDVTQWKRFSPYRPFVRGIHRPPVDSPYKGSVTRTLTFSLMLAWTNSWINRRVVGDFGCHDAHCDVIVMYFTHPPSWDMAIPFAPCKPSSTTSALCPSK